ncbi:hypothetical protein ACRHK7_01085 [Weissella tructae]|uniref:hypothetical protein n=1 Tax=Weissella tructae TaxID=887702 RepID=UPI003D8CF406
MNEKVIEQLAIRIANLELENAQLTVQKELLQKEITMMGASEKEGIDEGGAENA